MTSRNNPTFGKSIAHSLRSDFIHEGSGCHHSELSDVTGFANAAKSTVKKAITDASAASGK
jgi:hypothetical protein